MSFVYVPAEAFASALAPLGFVPTVVSHEVVYELAHPSNPAYKLRVFTSLSSGAGVCRAVGADAVRVCLAFSGNGKSFGLAKGTRVNRTGEPAAVIGRMLSRVAEMRPLLDKFVARGTCSCGGPRWWDSGRCVGRCESGGVKSYLAKKSGGYKPSGFKPKFSSYGWKNNEDVGVDYGPDGS